MKKIIILLKGLIVFTFLAHVLSCEKMNKCAKCGSCTGISLSSELEYFCQDDFENEDGFDDAVKAIEEYGCECTVSYF